MFNKISNEPQTITKIKCFILQSLSQQLNIQVRGPRDFIEFNQVNFDYKFKSICTLMCHEEKYGILIKHFF